jgi:putative ABC transport system permease protein
VILLRLLSWPYLRKHVLRWMLTLAGIALGATVFVATHAANQSVRAAFERTVEDIAGATQLQVSAGGFGFPEEVLERVQSLREVRAAVPVIEAVIDTGLKGQGNLYLLGVDLTGDRTLRRYELESGEEAVIDDPLVFLAQPDSIMLTREFAERNGLQIASRIRLGGMEGEKWFTVRGIMRPEGMGKAFGGNLAVMDIYAAQKVFGRGRRFDRIDVAVEDGVRVEQCQAALRRVLGPGFEVEPPSARGQHFESMLQAFGVTVNVSSLFALLIGMFMIYNCFAIAVTQRRAEIGVLRALGATRGQIRGLFLGESAVAGVIGSLAGVAAGLLMARAGTAYIARLTQEVYGVVQNVEQVSVPPGLLAGAVILGVVASMISAWIPARNAARVDPVQALQKGKYQVLAAGENRLRRVAAGATASVSAACLVFGRADWVFYGGYILMALAALLLAPTLALWLARLLRPVLRWLRPVEGALAADSLLQAPRRTSATVSALMLALALVVGFGGVSGSIHASVMDWLDTALNPDLFVTPTENLANRTFTFPAEMGPEVERLEGVREVQLVRSARVLYRKTPVTLYSLEMDKLWRTSRRRTLVGDAAQAHRLAAEGRGVIVSDAFARLRGVGFGETVELPTPQGWLRLPVVGITRDYSDQQGSVALDRSVYERWWRDSSINVIRVYLKPGASPAAVQQRIQERFSGRRLLVLSNQEVRQNILRLTDQWFAMSYSQIAVAIAVAVLGIVNTLIVSIMDRRRELGVLQAVGGLRRQVRHTVWMEALAIGAIGLALGLALGAVNLLYGLENVFRIAGLRLDYRFPVGLSLLLVPLILAAAWVAALGPARAAVRARLVEALEYE